MEVLRQYGGFMIPMPFRKLAISSDVPVLNLFGDKLDFTRYPEISSIAWRFSNIATHCHLISTFEVQLQKNGYPVLPVSGVFK